MKKLILLFSFAIMSANLCQSQEWFTSIEVAKRLALVQDKMLFVIWEASLDFPYPLVYSDSDGNTIIIDLSEDTYFDTIIWEHFIPVLLPEIEYERLSKKAKERGEKYIAKLNDESIKIMDANGYILNTKTPYYIQQDLSELIEKYSLRTTFLKQYLINFSEQESFTTSFNLGNKYIDYALFVGNDTREEIIDLANIYFNEARNYLTIDDIENKAAYAQRIDLLKIKERLILDNARRTNRLLKKIKPAEIDEINIPLFSFLNYTTFMLLKDEENMALWKSEVTEADLKKAELILNINN